MKCFFLFTLLKVFFFIFVFQVSITLTKTGDNSLLTFLLKNLEISLNFFLSSAQIVLKLGNISHWFTLWRSELFSFFFFWIRSRLILILRYLPTARMSEEAQWSLEHGMNPRLGGEVPNFKMKIVYIQSSSMSQREFVSRSIFMALRYMWLFLWDYVNEFYIYLMCVPRWKRTLLLIPNASAAPCESSCLSLTLDWNLNPAHLVSCCLRALPRQTTPKEP